jgi:hypothetical protein
MAELHTSELSPLCVMRVPLCRRGNLEKEDVPIRVEFR